MYKDSGIIQIERSWEKKLKGIGLIGPEVAITGSFNVKVTYQALDSNNPNSIAIGKNPTEFLTKVEAKIVANLMETYPLSVANIKDKVSKFVEDPKKVITTALANTWDEVNPLNAYIRLKNDFIATGVAVGKSVKYLENEFVKKYGSAPAAVVEKTKSVGIRTERLKTKLKREALAIKEEIGTLTRNSEEWLTKAAQYYHILGLVEGSKKYLNKEKDALNKLEILKTRDKSSYPIPESLTKPINNQPPAIQEFLETTPENYPVPSRLAGKEKLPDTLKWVNRFAVTSAKSGNTYVVAQNKNDHSWGCSCKSWIFKRTCPHLRELELD